jgi:hypothetical protein
MARNELDKTVDFLNFLSNEQTARNTSRLSSQLDELTNAQNQESLRRREKENRAELAITRLHEAIEFIPNIDRKESNAGKLVVALAIHDSVSSINAADIPDLATRERLSEVKSQLEYIIGEQSLQVDADLKKKISEAIEKKQETERKSPIAANLYVYWKMREAIRFYLVHYDVPTRLAKILMWGVPILVIYFVLRTLLGLDVEYPRSDMRMFTDWALFLGLFGGGIYLANYKIPKDAKEAMKQATNAVGWEYVEPLPVTAAKESYERALELARQEELDHQPFAVSMNSPEDVLSGYKMLGKERESANEFLRSL